MRMIKHVRIDEPGMPHEVFFEDVIGGARYDTRPVRFDEEPTAMELAELESQATAAFDRVRATRG